jgi:hypothetical protein
MSMVLTWCWRHVRMPGNIFVFVLRYCANRWSVYFFYSNPVIWCTVNETLSWSRNLPGGTEQSSLSELPQLRQGQIFRSANRIVYRTAVRGSVRVQVMVGVSMRIRRRKEARSAVQYKVTRARSRNLYTTGCFNSLMPFQSRAYLYWFSFVCNNKSYSALCAKCTVVLCQSNRLLTLSIRMSESVGR